MAKTVRCWIGLGGHEIEVVPGQMLVGRHDSCDIVLDDPQASRRHAVIRFDGVCLTIEDLSSVNGVIVNGRRASSVVELKGGDELRFGSQKGRVHLGKETETPRRRRIGAATLSDPERWLSDAPSKSSPEGGEATAVRDGEALETLTAVADKVLSMGRGPDAERILVGALRGVLTKLQAGETVDGTQLTLAGTYAVRLAQATRAPKWLEFVFELYLESGDILPATIVEALYEAVRQVPGLSMTKLNAYLRALEPRRSGFSPTESFLMKRIEGLAKLVRTL